jgi:hypothetical protein
MRVGILLLVVAALLLLWLVVGWRGGVDPRNYEVEYAVAAVYETATGRRVVEVARWVMGVGEENYTEFRRLTAMSEYTLYAATERGRVYTAMCVPDGGCGPSLPFDFKLSPFIKLPSGGTEAGPCEYLGWRGVVYRYKGVAVSLPHAASMSRDSTCASGAAWCCGCECRAPMTRCGSTPPTYAPMTNLGTGRS